MKLVRASLLAGFCLFVSTPAFAQATRTWVSGVGDDVNPCSRTAPCKTFAGAISKTAANGEINVIDPGGFGTVTITKSIVIDGLGPMASLLAVNTNGVNINGAGITVTLRNLTINCAGATIGNGIRIVQAAAVNIENVVIENCAGTISNGRGISIETSTANVRVNVRNVSFMNNNWFAIESTPPAGNVILNVDNSHFFRGGASAIVLRRNTVATINEATVNGFVGAAVSLDQTSTSAYVANSSFVNNGYGIFNGDGMGGAPTSRLFATAITGSTTSAIAVNGGQVLSHGNNGIRGNAGNEAPTGNAGTQ